MGNINNIRSSGRIINDNMSTDNHKLETNKQWCHCIAQHIRGCWQYGGTRVNGCEGTSLDVHYHNMYGVTDDMYGDNGQVTESIYKGLCFDDETAIQSEPDGLTYHQIIHGSDSDPEQSQGLDSSFVVIPKDENNIPQNEMTNVPDTELSTIARMPIKRVRSRSKTYSISDQNSLSDMSQFPTVPPSDLPAEHRLICENLEVIRSIKPYNKLRVSSAGELSIDQSYVPSVTRKLTGNNKMVTIAQITETIRLAKQYQIIPQSKQSETDPLEIGLCNLAITYAYDDVCKDMLENLTSTI
jgi:hypothetical protein